jgi:xanthine dehydrogenase accessory factor
MLGAGDADMAGEQAVLRALADLGDTERGALATVVHVDGSAYRREGAQMLILPGETEAPRTIGLLSGGCLEDDVAAHGRQLLAGGPPILLHYDLRADGEDLWGLGLGCNGAVDVLVQSLQPGPLPYVRAARWLLDGYDALVATVIESEGAAPPPGRQLALREDGEAYGSLGHPHLDAVALSVAGAAQPSHSDWLQLPGPDGGRVRVFFDRCRAPAVLCIFGAGADVPPVVAMAARLGFRVFVVDHRRALLTADRLPGAERLLPVRPEDLGAGLAEVRFDAAVVMTHNFASDTEILRYLLGRPHLAYLGVLGPAARTERILRRIGAQAPSHLYGPVGLDIGAATPEEIACSILAEAIAVLRGRSGGHLRDHPGPIHATAAPVQR